jgi:anaerobic magnesium-protoporphyrin IX monomethyl ester cyclase
MKIVFVNPPHIRTKESNPENNFEINKFVFKPTLSKIKASQKVFSFLNKVFGLGKGVRYGVRAGSRWPWTMAKPHGGPPYPFFMGYAAANLKAHGFDVNILDAIAEEQYSYDAFFEEVKREKADIVVIECSTPTVDIDVWFANRVAEFTDVALAGPHLNETTVKEIQNKNPKIKYFLLGEYIVNSLKMATTLVPGSYATEVLKDVDSIPFPFRDYKSATKYYDPSMPTPRPQLQVYGSKGCPFKCTFCSWPQNMYFGNVSLRDPKKIAQEIKEAVARCDYQSIFFDDDTFNMGTKRISELCDYLKEIGLPWTMMGRLDISPDWLYDKMVESGCVGMRFGIETFNLDVLKRVEKGIERTDFKATLEYITTKHPQLMIHITMMRDMPGQTLEDHENDMKIIKNMGFSPDNIHRSYQLSRCVPFPGTKLYEQMKAEIGEEKLKEYTAYDGGKETVMKSAKK